jgi:Enhancer of polycomb-like
LESELAVQVEYDMDEQGQFRPHCSLNYTIFFLLDQEWLDTVNTERKKEQLNKVSYETFEIVMDRLEKEWFDLVCHPQLQVSQCR